MRDLVAGLIAIGLLLFAASLATTLQVYRRRRQRARDSERALGRTIIAEIPGAEDLTLFSEDTVRFHYGERSIDKDLISSVKVLINGVPIATTTSRAYGPRLGTADDGRSRPDELDRFVEDKPEGIARDRWDVAIETFTGTIVVECGAIRERVSQELARAVYDAVKRDLERRGGDRL